MTKKRNINRISVYEYAQYLNVKVKKKKKPIKQGDRLYYNTAPKQKVGLKTTKRTKNDVLVGYAISNQKKDDEFIIIYKSNILC